MSMTLFLDGLPGATRLAPVQASGKYWLPKCDSRRGEHAKPAGIVRWSEHLEAWAAYDAKYRGGQSAECDDTPRGARFVRIKRYEREPETRELRAHGVKWTLEDFWTMALDSEEIINLFPCYERPTRIGISEGARAWVLRGNYPFRNETMQQLEVEGLFEAPPVDVGSATVCFVKVCKQADVKRQRIAAEALRLGIQSAPAKDWAASAREWHEARLCAELANAVSLKPDTEIYALLLLCYENVARLERAYGLLEVMRRSWGAEFMIKAMEARERLAKEIAGR